MSERNGEVREWILGVLAAAAFVLLGVALVEAATTDVSVPMLWPLATSAATLWLGWREVDAWARRRGEARDAATRLERERQEALHPRGDSQAITLILHRGPYESDLDGRRIGDAERDIVVTLLHAHFAAGRLDQGELEERLARALAGKTLGDLRRLVMDLPNGEVER